MNLRTKLLALAASYVMLCGSAQAIIIELDYSYDTTGFFTAERRGVMEDVASLFERNLLNHFGAVTNVSIPTIPAGSTISSLPGSVRGSLAADTIRVYLGAQDWEGNVLAMGNVGRSPYYGRPVGGMISFDTIAYTVATVPGAWNGQYYTQPETRHWYADPDVTTTEALPERHIPVATQPPYDRSYWIVKDTDFYSTALHEMGHVLGLQHVDGSILSTAYGKTQTPSMGAILDADRKYFTEYDWLQLQAAGWQVASLSPDLTVSAVPEPSTYAMLLGGLGMIGFMRRRRA